MAYADYGTTRGAYPQYPSYLDYVFAPAFSALAKVPRNTTTSVRTPRLVDEPPEAPQTGGEGSAAAPGGEGPATVGEAAAMSARGGAIPGINGLVSSGNTALLNSLGTLALSAFGLGVPTPHAVFTLSNVASGHLAGLNIDPTTGLRVGSQEFQSLIADPMFSQFVDLQQAPVSPFMQMTFQQQPFGSTPGSPSSNPSGAHADPTSVTGFTPSNVVDEQGHPVGAATGNAPQNSTNFGAGEGNTSGGSPGGAGDGAAGAGGPGGAGSGPGPGGDGMHTGGMVKDRTRGTLEERITAQQGEYVIRRGPSTKYRRLLEAINQDRPVEVKRLASTLRTRMLA
jgi:hypothetical protein